MLYHIASLEGVTHGLYLLWWVQEKHVSAALVATVLAGSDLAVMALEVPTGWLADRFGDRRSLVAGSCAQVAGMLACWLFPGVSSLVAGGLLIALGDALRSGADQALLYRSCLADGFAGQFQRIEGRTRSSALLALVLLTLGGGRIVDTWGWDAAWALDTALCGAGIVVALAMTSPPAAVTAAAAPDPSPDLHGPPPDLSQDLPPARFLTSPRMLLAILPAAVVAAAASAVSFVAQVGAGASPDTVTAIVSLFVLAEAAGLAAGGRVPPLRTSLQVGAAAVALLGLVVSSGTGTAAAPLLAVLLSFAAGLLAPWRSIAIQRLASDGLRATAASLASASDMACSTLLLPFAALLRRRSGR